MLGTKVAMSMGIIRSICLVSSTCVTGHNIHADVGPVFTAALSNILQAGDIDL
ncbi:hypothetical protein DsansV1_C05g0051561 [Dioscorea sansibarensis]